MRVCAFLCLAGAFSHPFLFAQEASSGIDLSATVSGQVLYSHELTESPRDGSSLAGGFRSVLYPVWKIGEHWSFSGAVQIVSRPYFQGDFSTQGYGLKGSILQGSLGYSTAWKRGPGGSIIVRAGQLLSAFGSFPLRYDDAVNPLIGVPMQYGYYAAVTTGGLAGAQADMTLGKWDGRVQFANSSPANPRSIFDKDQYANWAGGIGYTIRQGLRVGASAYRGPYLNRTSAYFLPGESRPKDLPATAFGVDAQWARGHWNLYGEWQRFELNYHVLPTFRENAGYFEAKRVLHPRWYVAARAGYLHGSFQSGGEAWEASVGFRPNTHQLVKVGYIVNRERDEGDFYRTFGVQLVTTLHPLSMAWR